MALLQQSVLKKYLKTLPKEEVAAAYQKFQNYFQTEARIKTIRSMKEEEYQDGFLDELFVEVLGYTKKPNEGYNLEREKKNTSNAKKADGAISVKGEVTAVIELKSTSTTDIRKIEHQAFGYKSTHPKCKYVITSNFAALRFYINDTTSFEDFYLFDLTEERFSLLYLLLCWDNVAAGLPEKMKQESVLEEEKITKRLYKDYSDFKLKLFESIKQQNPQYDELLLFKKTQKLLDRILFVLFAEDKGLLPPNSISRMINRFEQLQELDSYKPLYHIFKQYFGYMNKGRKGKTSADDIHAYNGGLFYADEVLDNLEMSDNILMNHCLQLSKYDFETEVDVNILGHIFEHSLNEIEEISAKIEGKELDKGKTKRKKDGVFYTPKYITKYIVENTIGKLCEEQKAALGIEVEEYLKERKGRKKATLAKLEKQLQDYQAYLFSLKIIDPACGSGAFLNEAFNFLIEEHEYIAFLRRSLFGESIQFDVTNDILEKNLYGVDINEESVDIAKLSLWLRTAKKGRTLASLNNNIKCGNSLIDDESVAGAKAFKWEQEFSNVFEPKDKQAFHVVLTTHNSRTSARMLKLGIQKGEPIELELEEEIALTEIIGDIIREKGYHCIAYNVCKDHVHLLLVCEAEELTQQVQIIKTQSSKRIKPHLPMERVPLGNTHRKGEETYTPFWSQKFFRTDLNVWELASLSTRPGYVYKDTHLERAIPYIIHNREKHGLPASEQLQAIIQSFVVPQENAFQLEYKGGFDVVIGNPPYVRQELISDIKPYLEANYQAFAGTGDLFTYFYEKGVKLLNKTGLLSFITNDFNKTTASTALRKYLKEQTNFIAFDDFSEVDVFKGTTTYPVILTLSLKGDDKFKYCKFHQDDITNLDLAFENKAFEVSQSLMEDENWTFKSETEEKLFSKLGKLNNIRQKIGKCYFGIKTGFNEAFIIDSELKKKIISESPNDKQLIKPFLEGRDLKKWHSPIIDKHVIFTRRGTDIDEYPAIKAWLGQYQERLTPRNSPEQKIGRKKGKYKWFEIQDSVDYYELFEQAKITWPNLQNKNKFCLDETDTYINNPSVILPCSDKALLAILNSKLVWYFLTQICVVRSGGYIEVKAQYFEQIPIADYSSKKEELSSKTEAQIKSTSEIQNIQSKFLRLLKRKFDLEKPSKKLSNWHTLSFDEFVKELKKKKIKLSLSEEAEWEDYFEAERAKAQQLQASIQATDQAIDKMVYALYGLTEEEIGIVEGAS